MKYNMMSSCCIRVVFFSLFFKFPVECYLISVIKHWLRKNSRLWNSWLYKIILPTKVRKREIEDNATDSPWSWEELSRRSPSSALPAPPSLGTGSSRIPPPRGTQSLPQHTRQTLACGTFIHLECLGNLRALSESVLDLSLWWGKVRFTHKYRSRGQHSHKHHRQSATTAPYRYP